MKIVRWFVSLTRISFWLLIASGFVAGQGGHFGTGKPSISGAGRSDAHQFPGGATVGTEEAVLDGLRWLLRHQNEDGSWSAASVHTHCTKTPCIAPDADLDSPYDVGLTALSLLAFLGQGIHGGSTIEIVDSRMGKRYKAGDVVARGVRWLRERQDEEGDFSDSLPFEYPENEALATMALCEAYRLSHDPELEQVAQKAVDFLVAAQKRNAEGARWGWGLGSHVDIEKRHAAGDINDEDYQAWIMHVELPITCWVVMALRSAEKCGFRVDKDVLQGALSYALSPSKEATRPESAPIRTAEDEFVYHGPLSAMEMLICLSAGQDLKDPYLEKAAEQLASNVPEIGKDGLSADFSCWFFGTLALNQYDGPNSPREGQGKYWEPWNDGLVKSLTELQDDSTERNDCARGGWLSDATRERGGHAIYNTALSVLTLEVYYRFDNVFVPPARPRKPR